MLLVYWYGSRAAWSCHLALCLRYTVPPSYPAISVLQTVLYSRLPEARDENGLVALVLNSPEETVRPKSEAITSAIHQLAGSKPNLSVHVDSIRPLPGNKYAAASSYIISLVLFLSVCFLIHRISVFIVVKRMPNSCIRIFLSLTNELTNILLLSVISEKHILPASRKSTL